MAVIASGDLSPTGLCVARVIVSTPFGVSKRRETVLALFDSGSDGTAIRADIASRIHLPEDGVDSFKDVIGVECACFTSSCSLLFVNDDDSLGRSDNLTITPQVMVVKGAFEHECGLIIGTDSMEGLVFTADYRRRRFQLSN